jgi:hypothetical protein
VAVSRDNDLTLDLPHQYKLSYSNNCFHKTPILFFDTLPEAVAFYARYQERAQSNSKLWCEYCRDVSKMEGILYQPGKVYVTNFEGELRELMEDVSQLVVVDGAAVEEVLKKEESGLFRFLDEVVPMLVRIRSAWKGTFTDGEYTPTSWATVTKNIEGSPL